MRTPARIQFGRVLRLLIYAVVTAVIVFCTNKFVLPFITEHAYGQAASEDLFSLVTSGVLRLEIHGRSTTYLQPLLSIQATLAQDQAKPVVADITKPGQILRSVDPYCDVVVLGLNKPFELDPKLREQQGLLNGYCLQVAPKDHRYPIATAIYTMTGESAPAQVLGVLEQLRSKKKTTWAGQLAIWAVASGNLTPEALHNYTGYDVARYWSEIMDYLPSVAQAAPTAGSKQVTAAPLPLATATMLLAPTATSVGVVVQPHQDAATPIQPVSTATRTATGSPSASQWGVLFWGIVVGVGGLLLFMLYNLIARVRTPATPPSDWQNQHEVTVEPTATWNRPRRLASSNPLVQRTGSSLPSTSARKPNRTATKPLETRTSKPAESSTSETRKSTIQALPSRKSQSRPAWQEDTLQKFERQSGLTERLNPRTSRNEIVSPEENQIVLRVVDDADNPVEMEGLEFSLPASGGILAREASQFIVIDRPDISDPHAMLRLTDNELYVRDLYSRNFSWVNNEKLNPGDDRLLNDEDELKIGNTHLDYDRRNRRLTVRETNIVHNLRTNGGRWIIGRRKLPFAQHLAQDGNVTGASMMHKTISNPHAKLELRRGILLRDLNSSNGTRVNEHLLDKGESRLIQDGDRIQLGRVTLVVDAVNQLKGLVGQRYEIKGLLAEGGMARIFKVLDTRYKVEYALKQPQPGQFKRKDALGQDYQKSFQRELGVSEKLDHPNLIKVREVGEDAKSGPYLIMDYVPGFSLRQILDQDTQIELITAAEIACQLVLGLQYLHGQGWVHCDVKPDNILISNQDSKVVLIDFGAVQQIGSKEIRRFGTREYIPLDYEDDTPATPTIDAYMLGCTLYEMLQGRSWGKGKTQTSQPEPTRPFEMSEGQSSEYRLSEIEPVEVRTLLDKALQPRNRSITLDEFSEVLEPYRPQDHSLAKLFHQS